MKRDRDDTDFRKVVESYLHRESGCVFCDLPTERILLKERTLRRCRGQISCDSGPHARHTEAPRCRLLPAWPTGTEFRPLPVGGIKAAASSQQFGREGV